jgi:methyl-accepting chemotaxis protein
VLVVALGLGWVMRRQQRALQQLAWGMKRLGRGQLDFRLEVQRRDEFSDAFRQFNRLAVRLEEAHDSTRPTSSAPSSSGLRLRPIEGQLDDTLDLSAEHAREAPRSPASEATGTAAEALEPTIRVDGPSTEKLGSPESTVTPLHGDRKGR